MSAHTATDVGTEHPKWGTAGTHCVVCTRPFATAADGARHEGKTCEPGSCWCEQLCWVEWGGECHDQEHDDELVVYRRLRIAVDRIAELEAEAERMRPWYPTPSVDGDGVAGGRRMGSVERDGSDEMGVVGVGRALEALEGDHDHPPSPISWQLPADLATRRDVLRLVQRIGELQDAIRGHRDAHPAYARGAGASADERLWSVNYDWPIIGERPGDDA